MLAALRIVAACVLVLASMVCARTAGASLSEDAARASALLAQKGAASVDRKTVFLDEGHPVQLRVGASTGCAVAVVLAARSVSFSALVVGPPAAPPADAALLRGDPAPEPERLASRAGLLVLSSCDGSLDAVVTMASARGALEILTAVVPAALGDLSADLDRELGLAAPRGDPGPPLAPGSLLERRRRADDRARADGATNVLPLEMKAGPLGNGELRMRLPAGCHRLDVMAEVTVSPAGLMPPVDVDVELRHTATSEVIVRDRGETPDARVEACVAEVTELSLHFRGAPPEARVVISDAIWPLPRWVPQRWGPAARAALAMAVRRRIGGAPARGPVAEVLGAQGTTQIAVVVEPDRCYVAAVALMKGSSRGLRLAANASARTSSEEVPATAGSPSVVFCADGTDVARVSVEVPGVSVWWVLAVWQLGASSPAADDADAPAEAPAEAVDS